MSLDLVNILVAGPETFQVQLSTELNKRTRKISVDVRNRQVVRVAADDGSQYWTEGAGDERLTKLAKKRAVEEAVRLAAVLRVTGGKRR